MNRWSQHLDLIAIQRSFRRRRAARRLVRSAWRRRDLVLLAALLVSMIASGGP